MRGIRTHSDFFNDTVDTKHRKGRSKTLHQSRNLAILYRYYYYSKFTKMRYDLVIEALSNEFYLSHITLVELINDNIEVLSKVKKESPSIAFLKTNYKHYNWSLNDIEFIKKN